jgi:hypothetical protein
VTRSGLIFLVPCRVVEPDPLGSSDRRRASTARPLGGEHCSGDGAIIYKHACALGCEGVVSKRLGSQYRAGRPDVLDQGQEPSRARDGVSNISTMMAAAASRSPLDRGRAGRQGLPRCTPSAARSAKAAIQVPESALPALIYAAATRRRATKRYRSVVGLPLLERRNLMSKIGKVCFVAICLGIAFPPAVWAGDRVIIIERGGAGSSCKARCMRQSDHCNAMNGGVQSINGCGIKRMACLSQC